MYTVDGLEGGITQCRNNIDLLEKAIEKERTTIKDYHAMIESIGEADRKMKEAEAGVHVEVCRDD